MSSILSYSLLLLVGILSYFILVKVLTTEYSFKRKRLSGLLNSNDGDNRNAFIAWLDRKGILNYVNPNFVIEEARKNGVILTKQSYISTFVGGTVIGVIVFIIYFSPFMYLIPLSVIGGVIATLIRLHNIKKEYLSTLDSKVAIYMSALSTSYATFNNPGDAIKAILPSLENPVKDDVEKAYLSMADGKDVKTAFNQMNMKYPQKNVRLFHDQFDVLAKSGSTDISSLRGIAFKMKKKETFKRKLQTAYRQQFKTWKAFVMLILSLPFLFIFFSFENYLLAMSSPITSIVYALVFLMIGVVYRKLQALEMYDPTDDANINL